MARAPRAPQLSAATSLSGRLPRSWAGRKPGRFLTEKISLWKISDHSNNEPISESVVVLAEGRETHCIFCLVTGFLYKFLSIPDT